LDGEPFGQGDLLLVAAGEIARDLFAAGSFHLQSAGVLIGEQILGAAAEETTIAGHLVLLDKTSEFCIVRHCSV
jgi:hypothetical protein